MPSLSKWSEKYGPIKNSKVTPKKLFQKYFSKNCLKLTLNKTYKNLT